MVDSLVSYKGVVMEEWMSLREAGKLLGVSWAAMRYRTLKRGRYEHKRDPEQQNMVLISYASLLAEHPELKDGPLKPHAHDVPAPEEGPQFVVADRVQALVTELASVERRPPAQRRR